MFALLPCHRNDFYTLLSNGLDLDSNFSLRFSALVMTSYLSDHLCLSGSKVWEHLGRIAEVEMELTSVGALLETVCQSDVYCLALDYMPHFCGGNGVLNRVSHGMIHKWFDRGIFRVLH